MLLLALVLVPALGAAGAWLDDAARRRAVWLAGVAALHLGLVAAAWLRPPAPWASGWLALDPLGLLVLSLTSVVFAAVACFTAGALRRAGAQGRRGTATGLLAFLSAASLVTVTHHFGLLWVGMEATTLATAPLIVDPHDRRSLEAVWKYLLVCSVGIALALLGTFFLATAQVASPAAGRALVLDDLVRGAAAMHPSWLRAAFVLLLVGFGTKMGLVPMHAWLPDAHGEAPAHVSALLSGVVLNLAFLAVLRGLQVVEAAGLGGFARPLLTGFGLLSLLVAAAFLLRQENYKRMLAYSSIEHMGLLAIGVGVAGVATWGALYHMLGASLAKAVLFLAAGNLVAGFGSKHIRDVSGALRVLPVTGVLFLAGLFAITGSPPFGPFLSELALLAGAVQARQPVVVIALAVLQGVIFVATASAVLGMVLGPVPAGRAPLGREDRWSVVPPAALLALVLLLGVWVPGALRAALAAAAGALGGTAP